MLNVNIVNTCADQDEVDCIGVIEDSTSPLLALLQNFRCVLPKSDNK